MKKIIKITSLIAISLIFGGAVFVNPSFGSKVDNKNVDKNKVECAQDEIIVKFKGDAEPFRIIKIPKGKVKEKIKDYQKNPEVEYAEPNYLMFALDSNDTAYSNQWALNNTAQTIYHGSGNSADPVDETNPIGNGTNDADVDWKEAWNNFADSNFNNVIVAIVDSGIDETHPDLNDKIVAGYDFVGKDNNPHDGYGHGTHVAGTAAAETNNNTGVAGVAFSDNVKIMPIRVLNNDGWGYTSNVVKGIKYAVDNGAKVINLSLGGGQSKTLERAIKYAWDKGAVLAAAAGNDGNAAKYYPASYSKVISVAATDYNDSAADFSNYNDEVDISAPGVNVFSTFPAYEFVLETKYGRSRNYDVASGTSMAVPHIAGLAGLLFAQDSNRDNADVRNIIETTANDLGTEGRDNHFGYGRINVYTALSYGSCASDDDCSSGEICCSGKCIAPVCTESGGECNDGENCTADTCVNPGTCQAYCQNVWSSCNLSVSDGCCGPECDCTNDIDCQTDPCDNCFKGVCDGKCNPRKENSTCPDCQ